MENIQRKTISIVVLLLIFGVQFPVSAVAEDWVYTVRKGDTLWDLCLEYTTEKNCWLTLGPYNQVDFPPSLAPGTRIRFPAAWLKNQPVKVELIYISGEVMVRENAAATTDLQLAQTGMLLGIGSQVQTAGESTATLKFADESILVLEENSEITLDLLSQQGEAGMVDSRLRLLRGATSVTVKKRETKSNFSITAPSAVAAVRGTKFRVSTFSEDEPIMLGSVYEGALAVNARKKDGSTVEGNADVPEGYGIAAKQNQPLPTPSKLLPAAVFDMPLETYSLPLDLSWKPVAGAESYRLQYLFDTDEDKLVKSVSLENAVLKDTDLENGCYRLQVNAIDNNGLSGMPAEIRFCAETPPASPLISRAVIDEQKNIVVEWSQQEGRSRFEIEISSNKNFSTLLHKEQVEGNSYVFPLKSNKFVYARVRALGNYGVLGEYSENTKISGKKSGAEVLLFIFLPLLLSL